MGLPSGLVAGLVERLTETFSAGGRRHAAMTA